MPSTLLRPVEVGRLHLRPGNPLVITPENVVIGVPSRMWWEIGAA
jgi:hypothetical protein